MIDKELISVLERKLQDVVEKMRVLSIEYKSISGALKSLQPGVSLLGRLTICDQIVKLLGENKKAMTTREIMEGVVGADSSIRTILWKNPGKKWISNKSKGSYLKFHLTNSVQPIGRVAQVRRKA